MARKGPVSISPMGSYPAFKSTTRRSKEVIVNITIAVWKWIAAPNLFA